MMQRVVLTVNGKIVYDSGLRDDIEVAYTENHDIADELQRFDKPSNIASRTLTVGVKNV